MRRVRRLPVFSFAIGLLVGCGGAPGRPFDAGVADDTRPRPEPDSDGGDVPVDRGDAGADAPTYTCAPSGLIDLGTFPDGDTTQAVDINASGHVLMLSAVNIPPAAFVWDPGTGAKTPVQVPAGFQIGTMVALNAGGSVVGSISIPGAANHAAFCAGECRDLGALDVATHLSGTAGLNDADVVIGLSATGATGAEVHAISWTAEGGMKDLGTLGGTLSMAFGINAAGQIVGVSMTATAATHAALWDAAGPHDLGTLGGDSSGAGAINDAGQVAGYGTTADGRHHAVLWDALGTVHDLGTLGGGYSDAFAINASGQVLGNSTTLDGKSHLFLWESGTMHDLGTLGGDVTATLGGKRSLNDSGQVVGYSALADGTTHAFLWQAGAMRDLGTLGGASSDAVAINAAGQVTGESLTADGKTHAFVYDPSRCQPAHD